MNWLSEGVNEYYEWLKKRTFVRKDEATGWSVVSTSFVGIFNDTIDIFVKTQAEGRILLSDDGNTLGNLELLGVNFKSSMGRKDILERAKLNYGVTFPIFAKGDVRGENAQPLFKYLTEQKGFKGFDENHPIASALTDALKQALLLLDDLASALPLIISLQNQRQKSCSKLSIIWIALIWQHFFLAWKR